MGECADAAVHPDWCVNPGTITRSGTASSRQLCAVCLCATYSAAATLLILAILSRVVVLSPDHNELMDLDHHTFEEAALTRTTLPASCSREDVTSVRVLRASCGRERPRHFSYFPDQVGLLLIGIALQWFRLFVLFSNVGVQYGPPCRGSTRRRLNSTARYLL